MAIKFDTPEAVLKAYARYMYDPAAWVQDILGVDPKRDPNAKPIDPQVRQILDSVGAIFKAKDAVWRGHEEVLKPAEKEMSKKKGISTRAGQGTGKDTANSWVMAWAGDVWPNAKIIITAPKLDQIKTILWAEFRKWIERRHPLTGDFVVPDWVRRKYDIAAETIKFNAGAGFCQAMTCPKEADPDKPAGSLFGLHADVLITIVTEADQVAENTLQPLTSTLTGPINFAMLAFNPRRTSGYAYKTHCDPVERKKWVGLHHSAEKSTLVSKASLEDKLSYGRDSNYYRVYALGEFPRAEDDSIIKWEDLMAAVERELEVPEDYPICAGVDPAGDGKDRTILVKRRMGELIELKSINQSKRGDTKEELLELLSRKWYDRKYIDANGLGYYLFVELAREIPNLRKIESQGAARNAEKFINKRAEMWFYAAEAFEQGLVSIPNNDRLIAGLAAAKWKTETKKLQVISKKDIKRKIGHSPDEAEALVMTFADGFQYYHDPKDEEISNKSKAKSGYNRNRKSFMGV